MELRYNREPKCPYCGHYQEMTDIPPEDGDRYDLECERCEQSFEVETHINVTYCTFPIVEEETY